MPPNPVNHASYRSCVGMMVLNKKNQVFMAQRIDFPDGAWQMPQGGINTGESPQEAALRELHEETGIKSVHIRAESKVWKKYDFPPDLSGKLWHGQYKGQRQKWFLMRFFGKDTEIDLESHTPSEFCRWRWALVDQIPKQAIPFKREIYGSIIEEFRKYF